MDKESIEVEKKNTEAYLKHEMAKLDNTLKLLKAFGFNPLACESYREKANFHITGRLLYTLYLRDFDRQITLDDVSDKLAAFMWLVENGIAPALALGLLSGGGVTQQGCEGGTVCGGDEE